MARRPGLRSSSVLLGVGLDALQLSAPVPREQAAPFVDAAQRVGVGPVERVAAVATGVDETDLEQHLQVLRRRRLVQLEGQRDLGDGSLLAREQLEDVPPARLGDGVEGIGAGRCPWHACRYTFPYGNVSSTGPDGGGHPGAGGGSGVPGRAGVLLRPGRGALDGALLAARVRVVGY